MTRVVEKFESFECKGGPGSRGLTYRATLKLIGDPASYPAEVVVSETVRATHPGGALSEKEWYAIVRVKLEGLASSTRADWAPGVTVRAGIDYRELEYLIAEAKRKRLIRAKELCP
jgi:hypothetical protein